MSAAPARAARGTALLAFTTFLWGTTFVVTKHTLGHAFFASELILGRFLVAGIVFLPFLRPGKKLWLAAVELGLLLWVGFTTQTIGLQYTTVNRSSFLTSLHVVFVPVLLGLAGRRTRPVLWFAAGLAVVGVYLLDHDGSPPNRGDWWTIGCAVGWAVYIIRLETLTARLPSKALTAAHLWVVVVLGLCWTGYTGRSRAPVPWAAVVYLGLFATAATTWFQTIGQKSVPAARAAILYTVEPVWSVVFSFAFGFGALGWQGWLGAGTILTAALIGALRGSGHTLPADGRRQKMDADTSLIPGGAGVAIPE